MPAQQLGALAVPVFGEDRVRVADQLDDAIDSAAALADDAGLGQAPLAAGVLVTGSVVTAGDARVLLGAPGTAGLLP
jgi:dihydrofolate synthase/folylpolyglutamate synthase